MKSDLAPILIVLFVLITGLYLCLVSYEKKY